VVTLNGGNNPDAKFLFQASTLNIGANTRIHLINAKAENVFWAVDTTAVLGADTVFVGSIIAGTAITLGAGAMLQGCALAGTAVTLGAGASIDVSGPTLAARRNLRGEKK
jgi:voltage-gated potassium channel Kch